MKKRNFVGFYLNVNRYIMYAMPLMLYTIYQVFRPFDSGIDIGRGVICSPLSYMMTSVAVGMALAFCILLKNFKLSLVETISKVCIVIMGLHMTIVQILWALKDKLPEMLYFICESPFESVTAFVLSVFAGIIMMKYVPFLIGDRR